MHIPALFAVGRILVGCMFLYSGVSKIFQFDGNIQMMRAHDFPVPRLALLAAIAWELPWAVLLIAARALLPAALSLAFFVLFATAMIHLRDARQPERRHMALVHIANNLTLIGGLLAIAAF